VYDSSISPEGACVGPCNHSSREAWRTYHRARVDHADAMNAWHAQGRRGDAPQAPQEPDVRFWDGSPLVCEKDKARIRAALTDLDEVTTLRLLHADGFETRGQNERVSGSTEPSSPSNAYDDLNELVRWLRAQETAYRQTQGWPAPPYRGESSPALTGAVAWLTAHLEEILALPALAAEFTAGVLKRHAQMQGAARARPRRVSKPLRCPRCHLATLSQEEGSELVECRNRSCGQDGAGPVSMTEREYTALVEITLKAAV
jgi:hypothetical protein